MEMNSINWRVWHLPWHNVIYCSDDNIWAHFAGIGPFQFHWYSGRRFW